MRRDWDTTSNLLFKSFWVGSSFLWIPLCFINFDPHHDGIILTTVNQLKLSLTNHGTWPFNQYGSVWAFPYLLISYLVPDNCLYFSIRLLTISFYVATSYILYKSALLLFNKKAAQATVIFFLTFQPFLGPWNTSLLPWPSSLVILLVSSILYLLLVSAGQESVKTKGKLVALGVLTAVILGSRIQVGVLLLLSISFLIYFLRIGKFRYFIYGIILWLTPWSVFLQLKGWLVPSLYDSVILGSQFLGSDHLHYPLPILSAFAGICVFIWLELTLARKMKAPLNILFSILGVIATLVFSKRVLGDSFNFANYISVTQRKILAALFFAALIYVCAEIIKLFLKGRDVRDSRRTCLNLISLCSAAQAWPFFDQMHIWWSFAPIVLVIGEKFSHVSFIGRRSVRDCGLTLIFTLMTFLVISQFTGNKTELTTLDQRFVFVNRSDDLEEARIQSFIDKNIPKGSHVLNLCPNAYPFFVPGKYVSDSRFFVYWSNFESAPIAFRDYEISKIDFVFVCQTYLYQGQELLTYKSRQQAILSELPTPKKLGSMHTGSFNFEIFTTNQN